jgi:regulator of sigma E protease
MLITIIVGIIVLSIIALFHEFGHFITAKASGVMVKEFGLGLPPRIIGKKWGETIYSINWIPFGAFNSMSGEIDPAETRSLAGKKPGVRILVFAAGSLMNILLAFLAFSIAFMVPHHVVSEPVMVKDIAPGSPAAVAGIRAGDTLLSVNDNPLENLTDLIRGIQLNLGEEITILTRHSDNTEEIVSVVPRWRPPEGEGAIGILLDVEAAELNQTVSSRSYPFWEAIPKGATELIDILFLYKDGIVSMIAGTAPVEVAGPVGIVQMTGEAAKSGISPLLEFAAIISLVIGIFNFFPLPALDGGRIVFVLLEWLRGGKRVSPRVEGMVHSVGFILLIAVMVAITYRDIARIITGDSLIP